ncbi:MAG TPA: hypothetical protein VEC39_18360 [Vicinamibacterales bacterium]|nr:hypothetical protein [Vicinamibacterales bacterium]
MTQHRAEDDPRVVDALASSAVLGVLAAMVNVVWRAGGSSRLAASTRRWTQEWRACPVEDRRSAISVAVIAAAVTCVALVWLGERPPGWLWLTPPAIALSAAILVALWPPVAQD